MEFLKQVLGEELYKAVEEKINAFNGAEVNKDKQIKLANLGTGEYVGKGKHDALQVTLEGKINELKSANDLIEELKKGTKNDEALQSKIKAYDQEVKRLQDELNKTKLDAAIKVALLEEKAVDIDYLLFKLGTDKDALKLEEDGSIKGLEDKIAGLKIKYPGQFEAGQIRQVEPNRLPKSEDKTSLNRTDILKMPYVERAKFADENPEAYREIMNK